MFGVRTRKMTAVLCLASMLLAMGAAWPTDPGGRTQSAPSGWGQVPSFWGRSVSSVLGPLRPAPAEAGIWLLFKMHGFRIVRLDIFWNEIFGYLLDSFFKRVVAIAIHSVLTGQNPAEIIKRELEGLVDDFNEMIDEMGKQIGKEVERALKAEFKARTAEVSKRMKENREKVSEGRSRYKKSSEAESKGEGSQKHKRLFENIPENAPLFGKGVDDRPVRAMGSGGGTDSPVGTDTTVPELSGIMTAVSELGVEQSEGIKDAKGLQFPSGVLPSVVENASAQIAHRAIGKTEREMGAYRAADEARGELAGMILQLAVANAELREAMNRVADQEAESTTVSDWRGGSKGKAYKAIFDFTKSRMANNSRGAGILLATMQTLRAKDRMLSVVAAERLAVYADRVRANIMRYNDVANIESQRIAR